ncbi:MAG: thioredoxin [Actinobacteria bacterium]|jgi:putative thioredoxin|nr:thioredoxin [Actinomycetota bacterium]MCL6095067.1 thioredoxin [Actinomycetota bacterium]
MIDVTDATFETEVLKRSEQVPVIVDLWAPWCGPCKTLSPIIERVVASKNGAVELAKVNVDENPGIATAFRVQSIPSVYVVRNREVVDGFIGALPEKAVQEFVDRFADKPPSEVDILIASGDEDSIRRALELDPDNEKAVVALAKILVERGEGSEALELLAKVPETPETRRIAAMVRLGDNSGSLEDAEERLNTLLDRVKQDEKARQEFLDILEMLGPDDERTNHYRRALATRLY